MDLFTADHRISSSDEFPQHASPFPDPTDVFFTNPSSFFHSSDVIPHRSNPPPQKLRPIRCNGRSPAGSHADNEIFDGTLRNCHAITSPEAGFTSDHLCAASIDPSEFFNSSVKDEPIEVAKDSDIIGNSCLFVGNAKNSGLDSVIATEDICPSLEGSLLDDDSCSTSDDDDDIASGKKPLNHKRKRRATRSLKFFMESLVMKVMDKQEQMHKQLIEMIEKKEKERIVREEAWKQREIERIRRDEELRAQESTRSLSLISLMQNFLDHEIQTSEQVENQCTEDEGGESSIQKDLKSDPSSKRWPKTEVQALTTLRATLDHKFRSSGLKGSIWEEISVRMNEMGHNRSAKKCKEKWENMNKYFKKTIGSRKTNIANGKACSYFQELDVIYRNGLGNTGAGFDSTSAENESKSEKSVEIFMKKHLHKKNDVMPR